ncbi:hypothetical protein PG995_004781 [Apiospora arundinis]
MSSSQLQTLAIRPRAGPSEGREVSDHDAKEEYPYDTTVAAITLFFTAAAEGVNRDKLRVLQEHGQFNNGLTDRALDLIRRHMTFLLIDDPELMYYTHPPYHHQFFYKPGLKPPETEQDKKNAEENKVVSQETYDKHDCCLKDIFDSTNKNSNFHGNTLVYNEEEDIDTEGTMKQKTRQQYHNAVHQLKKMPKDMDKWILQWETAMATAQRHKVSEACDRDDWTTDLMRAVSQVCETWVEGFRKVAPTYKDGDYRLAAADLRDYLHRIEADRNRTRGAAFLSFGREDEEEKSTDKANYKKGTDVPIRATRGRGSRGSSRAPEAPHKAIREAENLREGRREFAKSAVPFTAGETATTYSPRRPPSIGLPTTVSNS